MAIDKNIKILITDDSEFMRKVLRGILEAEGFSQFIEAGNGNEAIEKFKEEKPGLVLLDIIMPEVNGLEVLKEIGSVAKVLVISAVGEDSMVEDAKKAGAAGYILKPFDNKNVMDEINKVLGA